jgi:putative copper export protein/mono/diheme cytochrome c family protein
VLPQFDVEGGLALALVRGVSVAALLSTFGSLLFRAAVAPAVLKRLDAATAASIVSPLRRVTAWSLLLAVIATLAWLALESGTMAGANGAAAMANAIPVVLRDTEFGHAVLFRLAVLVLVGLLLWRGCRRPWPATVLAGVAVALQGAHSHAISMYTGPSLLLLSEVLHLLAAGAWLGGLLPLLLLIDAVPPDAAATASRRFSPLGTACVLVLAGTAFFQFWVLIGGLPELVGTGYGLVALLKLALFLMLLGFAARNRFRFTPALAGLSPEAAKLGLRHSIAFETAVGLAVVLAAGLLTNLPPAMHEQPLWPFAVRPSLEAVREAPEFRREVILAALALALALALAIVGVLRRGRVRWTALGAAACIAWFAAPHLNLLLVEAYPTSFYRSPTSFAAAGIARGAALFQQNCAACHGADGRGDGPAAQGLPAPPANLTGGHLLMHGDGELFWWLSHGIATPDGSQAMPGFASTLSAEDRWDLIDYIRAHNVGVAMREESDWPEPVQAPGLDATCAGGRAVTLADLRGQVVRLVIGAVPPAPSIPGITTIVAGQPPLPTPDGTLCTTDDAAVARAYAVVTGAPLQALAGTQVLIDGNGWLRALQRPSAAPGWNDLKVLSAEVETIRAHPIAAAGSSHAHMQM